MSKMTLILVRHGHVEGISPEKFRGQIDLPLTDLGRSQAAMTAHYLERFGSFNAIYSSPLARCLDTAAAIGRACGSDPISLPELIDINYGVWQGRTREAVSQEDPVRFQNWMTRPDLTAIPGADTLQTVQSSLVKAFQMFRERHEGRTVVAVGHDSSNRVMLLTALEMPLSRYWSLRQDPCCVNVIVFDGYRCTVGRINETAHLDAMHPVALAAIA